METYLYIICDDMPYILNQTVKTFIFLQRNDTVCLVTVSAKTAANYIGLSGRVNGMSLGLTNKQYRVCHIRDKSFQLKNSRYMLVCMSSVKF